jgi:hypothetical protein
MKMVLYYGILGVWFEAGDGTEDDVVKCTSDPLCPSSSTCWDGSLPICPRELGGLPAVAHPLRTDVLAYS